MKPKQRLQKVIAAAGVASRRTAEKLILAGKVKVNGQIVRELGTKVGNNDAVQVNGKLVEQEKKEYYLFYKPRGVISAVSDNHKRKVVVDYFPDVTERIYPIGRLDYDTSGILLLTNDGELANQLMHPRFKVAKTYLAKVKGVPTKEQLRQLQQGVVIDGRKTAPAKIKKVAIKRENSLWQLTIHEGRNHQVKKMFAAIGHPVSKLKRERYGFLDLDGLISGQYRRLTTSEVERLKNLIKQ
ncbi:MAG: pseudouridine synthase [Liquorilactobacillus ghanensis]|uniref:Pseudouridine synthase n=1 Tax=Liquorilactobacillus ghanensis DSM 18630 TaxID=1423750 RepID=A0A0R1VR83_9LACO|nr:pseudouridine synthase [Liquorilactobacillus ghanensis]KRM08266.1 ribosomal large subunit pseudouridine synthase B [Liquorilactobacillus ghanensis DSM 18630]